MSPQQWMVISPTENHELDWLYEFTLGDDATPYDDFYREIGAVIMGAETYEWIMKLSLNLMNQYS